MFLNRVSERQVYLYDCQDISNPIEDISLDVSPATLIPFYDEDSSTLFLSGKVNMLHLEFNTYFIICTTNNKFVFVLEI